MNSEPLSKVAPPKSSDRRISPDTVVWHLGLDQIISGSGEITNRMFGPAKDAGSSTFIFDERNVLYSKLRPYLNKVVCPDSIGVATTELVPLRPDPKRLDRQYLCFYLRSPAFVSWISSKVAGAKMPRAKMDAFWQHKIPLPPLDDQKRIAYLLSKVEGLIAQRKEHLRQLDDLLKSVFLTMFGDPRQNPKGFPLRVLSEFYASPTDGTKCGPFGSALKKEEIQDSGISVWNMDNIGLRGQMVLPFRMWITEEKFARLNSFAVREGDVIISRAGTVGKMCVAKTSGERAIISTNLIRLRLSKNLSPDYFVALMTLCKGRVGRLKTGPDGAFTHMNTGVLDSLEFPYPPLALQESFVVAARSIGRMCSGYTDSLAKFEQFYGLLSQQAFKGKLNLSRVAIPAPTEAAPVEDSGTAETTDHAVVDASFELSTPSAISDLATTNGRQTILEHWLHAYARQLGNQSLTVDTFMKLAGQKLSDLQSAADAPDIDYEISAADYDHVKDWVFENLESKRLKQDYADANNRVRISATKD